MIVVAGHQSRTGGRTGGEHVETRESQTLSSELVEDGCTDFAAERADIAVSQVIRHDEQNIRWRVVRFAG
jgi:coenzyme F420-reducing hydrogenase beta subunit